MTDFIMLATQPQKIGYSKYSELAYGYKKIAPTASSYISGVTTMVLYNTLNI